MAATQSAPALIPVTPEALTSAKTDRIQLTVLPFRVGREARFGLVHGSVVSMERRNTDSAANNDLYLHDHADFLNVSREHFQIEQDANGGFVLLDRGSTCGTIVDNVPVGVHAPSKHHPLQNGSTIRVGTATSPFVFRFESSTP